MSKDNIEIEEIYSIDKAHEILIPLLESRISAGFPSSAENYLERALDLNELLIKHPAATFFIKVKGHSMIKAGINSGDILIVDRSLSITNNNIIIARINDELTVKRIRIESEKIFLIAECEEYKPIEIKEGMDFEVWGIVIYVIHKV